jgi:hypothetical protein
VNPKTVGVLGSKRLYASKAKDGHGEPVSERFINKSLFLAFAFDPPFH